MLRSDPEAAKDDAGAVIRWMPVFVPLSGAAVLFSAFLIWAAVL